MIYKIRLTLFFVLLTQFISAQVYNYNANTKSEVLFFDDFETTNLTQWNNTNNWTKDNSEPISDNYSLKHNLSNIGGSSFISSTYSNADFDTKNTVWQLQLRNGNFNPSSSNLFVYYLMANSQKLDSAKISGYAVGVNHSGSTDTLSLWRVDNGTKRLLIKSDFLWKENTLASIEVTRDVAGNWKLAYSENNTFTNLKYTNSVKDDKYKYTNHGLYFKYSKTRAGLLWADNVKCYQENSPPSVANVKAKSSIQLLIQFSQIIKKTQAEQISNYLIKTFDNKTIGIKSAVLNSSDNTQVLLSTNKMETGKYSITVKNMQNTDGLVMNEQKFDFEYLEMAQKFDVVISEIMADPYPTAGLPEYEFVEITNISKKTIQLKDWKIVVKTNKKPLSEYMLKPNEKLILCSSKALDEFKKYGSALSVSSFPALTNSGALLQLLSADDEVISSVNYSYKWYKDEEKKDGGYSLEKIDLNNNCEGQGNWKASTNANGGTPGQTNSVNAVNIDNEPPQITMAAPMSDSTIFINFSESVTKNTIENNTNYELNSKQISILELDTIKYTWVKLKTKTKIQQKQTYTIKVKNIADKCDNIINDTSITFSYTQPSIYQIVINEIMTNPTPSVGLPEAEYIELYNNAGSDLHLFNWNIAIGKSVRKLPYIFFAKDSYLIVCKTEYKKLFEAYGNTIGVDNLSSLPLSGSISLTNDDSLMVCFTNYSSGWITDDFKADGGYSLERIDANNSNEDDSNWQVSNNKKGGTPGKENSVAKNNPDTKKFNLVRAVPDNNLQLQLVFNKNIDINSIATKNFTITPELNQPDSVKFINPYYKTLMLYYSKPMQENTKYTIKVDNIKDLSNFDINRNTDEFMIAQTLSKNDVIINEVLFEPNDDGVEFIELYNRSAKAINLSQLIVATRNDKNEIKSPYHIIPQGEIILPKEYKAISVSSEIIKQQYMVKNEYAFVDMQKTPSLSNTDATIVLIDTLGTVIDEFAYTSKMHFGLLSNTKGISLERISSERPTNEKGNWHSAAEHVGWATPGYKNSMNKTTENTDDEVNVEPEAFSPDNDGYNDVLNIHYNFDKAGYVANIFILNKNGVIIRDLTKNELLSQQGIITWDGLSNEQDKANVGIYIILFEVFDDNGKIKNYKKSCVVSTKF